MSGWLIACWVMLGIGAALFALGWWSSRVYEYSGGTTFMLYTFFSMPFFGLGILGLIGHWLIGGWV